MAGQLRRNPFLAPMTAWIDWRFWDVHPGHEDREHRQRTRAVIEELVGDDPSNLAPLQAGYFKGKSSFDRLWRIAHRRAGRASTSRARR